MKKFLISFSLSICLIVPLCLLFCGCNNNNKIYAGKDKTIEEAITQVSEGGTIILDSDIEITKPIVITKKVTIDLAEKSIKNVNGAESDLYNTDTKEWSLISVQENGELIIKNGTLEAEENDCFAIDVRNGGKCTIESGNYIGNISSVYVYEGELTVSGGKFSIKQLNNTSQGPYGALLNCRDEKYTSGVAKITVKGGSFQNFNPENNLAEGENTNFLADGYSSTLDQTTNYYVVSKNTKN